MVNTAQKLEEKSQKSESSKMIVFKFIFSPKRIVFLAIATLVFTAFLAIKIQKKVYAATGINQTINFQGKVVNKDGTNVADGQYTFVFKLYDAASNGSNLWTETQNNVQVTAGIFRVSLGSVTSLSGVSFNSDSIYLGINFNADGEMTPRVRFASVPYAFNAQQVNGLTVTNTSDNPFGSATTLKIADGKTVVVNAGLTFSGTDSTTFTFPSTGGNVVTEGFTQTLTNKTIGSTGLTFSGASLDITTGTNEDLTITPNGTGSVLINPSAGGSAALVINKTGSGDIFAASSSGVTKFVLKSDGTASSSAGFTVDGVGNIQSTNNQTLTVGGGSTGNLIIGRASQVVTLPGFDCSGSGNGGKLTTTSGGILTCSSDEGAGANYWQYDANSGIIAPGNLTAATLFGSTASNSALMTIAGTANSGTVPVASISARTSYAGLVVDNTTGDLFTASSSGLTRFVINQNGNVGIGKNIALASLDVKDLSSVASQGSEKITNSNDSTFASDTGNWTTSGSPAWKINIASSGKAVKDAPGTGSILLNNTALDSAPVAGNTYQVSFDYTTTSSSSGSLTLILGNATGMAIGTNTSENVTNQVQLVVASDNSVLAFTPTGNWYGTIDNISVKKITTSSVALRLESSDGTTSPFEIRTGGNSQTSIFIGNGSGRSNSTGQQNVGLGTQSLYSNTAGLQNTAIGFNSLFNNTTGSNNTAVGQGSLYANTTGIYNTAVGASALGNNTVGNYNVASGYYSLAFNTTGFGNTASGYTSLMYNTTGNGNSAYGISALYYNTKGGNNTANGVSALFSNTLGNYNAAFGVATLWNNTEGTYNSGIGRFAGFTNTVGGSNSFVGYLADVSQGNLINATAIGANAYVAGNDSLVLGSIYGVNSATGSAKIGIGVTAPVAPLQVSGSYGTNAAFILNQTGVGDLFVASASGTSKFVIKSDGTASSSAGFTVDGAGSLQSTNNQTLTIGGNTTGEIYLRPINSSGMVHIIHGTTGIGGLVLQDNEADAALKVGRLKFANFSNAQSPITGLIGVSDGNRNQLYIGGNSSSENAMTTIRFFTAGALNTTIGTERMRIDETGAMTMGNVPALGTAAGGTVDIRGISGTLPVTSVTGTTSFAAFLINNSGVGDLFTASNSGIAKFTIKNDGTASTSAGFAIDGLGAFQSTRNQTLTIGGNSTGDILFKPGNSSTSLYLASNGAIGVNGSFGALGQCLLSNGSGVSAVWGGCASGPGGNWFNLVSAQGTLIPINTTLDLLWGGTSTASAGFRIAGATKNYGTVAAASVSANTSFSGLVVDNRGTGELLTASSSGLTRFTIYNSGNVVIGSGSDSGFKLDVKGSVRIGNNTTTDDIVKDSTDDFTQSGYSISTNDSVNTISTSENQIKLVTDLIGAGASLTAPAASQTTGTNVTTGSIAFQRPDKKFVVYVGGATTSKIYDPVLGTWSNGPNSSAAIGAGAKAFQRQNGSFLIVHGGAATTTSVYSPGGSPNIGTIIAGPATTGNVGAGSQIIRRPDGKVLVIHGNTSSTTSVHDPVTATGTTSLIGSFIAGPATTGNVTTGSFAFQRADGKWIVGLGGGTTTNLYDPSSTGAGGGGTFSVGPSLTTGSPGAGTHIIQLPDGRFMVLIGGSGATQIYDWKSNSFSAGPSLATDTLGAGAHSFQRSDGKWIVTVGGNSKNLQLYDPTSGANGSFSQLTGVNGLQGATGAGAGALTIQRPDGKYIVVHGNTTQLTTLYDAGWNTTGTWTSEDILNTKISTYSAMIWSANPQSANNNARLDAETINIAIKTGDSLTSLSNNQYRTLQDSGDLIKAYGNAQYAKIQVTFSVPIRSYPSGATANIFQTNIWEGEGGTFLRRSFIQPTVFSMRIQNPLVSYGDPSGAGDPAFGRNFATASAQLEGVGTDNSNRLTLLTLRNQPTATASAGIIIASASANLGGNAGAGAHTIERNSGQFLTILGGGTTTTRIYDTDSNSWSAGPDLPNAAGAGAHSFLLPDGRFFVVLGNTTNKTAIFDTQSGVFLQGPNLFGNVGAGANSFQRPDGYYVILNGGATPATNILDPFTISVNQGPFTTGATPNVGAGAMNIKRSDGRFTIILGNGNAIATGTNVYDPASNAFAAGPALVGGAVNTGGSAIQINTGRILLFKSTATSNWYDPIQNTFTAGPTPTANGAGAFVIPRSDGKIFKANGGNSNATNIIDPQAGVAVTGTSAPTLPCNINTGAHTFQRPTGEYVVICGGSTANTAIIDAGWNLGGTYTTEQIQVPNLSSTSSIFWKNVGQGTITVKYRTASSQQALGVASWKDAVTSGSYLSPTSGDTWLQVRFDLQGYLQDLPGAKTRVWLASDSGGNMVYYRSVQAPILEYWKAMNIQDPTLLTLTSGGSNVFRFSSDGQAYTSDSGAWNSGGADLAERYQSKDTLQAGEVVSLDRMNPQNTKRSTIAYDQNAMGIVSTQPGFVAGAYTENSYPIALVGRVPVKVSTENGQIHAGDYLTSASIPGYAMKATVAGRVIGQAMEDFDGSVSAPQVTDCPRFGAGNLTTTRCGNITVFVNLTSYNGESVEVAIKDKGFTLKEEELPAIAGIDFTQGTDARRQQEVLGFLKTQKDNGQSIYTDRIAATQEIISPQIVTDLLVAKKIKAEQIEGLEIITNSIENLSNQLSTGSAVQSFSDRLNLLSLNQKDFEAQISSLSAKLDKISSLNILSLISQGSTSGDLTMVNNLASYGTTTLSEASIINSITIGTGSTLNLSNNSLFTLGDDLSIQPFRQGGVNFLGGLISFDTDGKAIFRQDVTFEKNVGVTGVLSATTVASTELQLGQGTTTVVSDTEVTATAAAGLVVLKKNTDHIKINNPLVRDNSFIFITPKTMTTNSLFLLDQVEGTSFTVGVDGKAEADIKFNYLIVN